MHTEHSATGDTTALALEPNMTGKPRLLLIDDDVALCRLIEEVCTARGFSVECCHDGRLGLARVQEAVHDAVLVDVMMPGLDGLSVLREIRRTSEVPVIILTARNAMDDRVAGLEAGADDYLPKPFAPNELVARVRAVLRRSTGGLAGGLLTAGDISVHPQTRSVTVSGKAVPVTATECDILVYLLRSAGRIVSRDELMERICHRPASPLERSLDVHISRLRRKLGVGPRVIRSVRGVGYILGIDATDRPRG
jgi:two-component system response regulator CpxR